MSLCKKGEKRTPFKPDISLGKTPNSTKEMLKYISISFTTHIASKKTKGILVAFKRIFLLII